MRQLENRVKDIAREHGAALVGIASRKRLLDAPLSADPNYLMPSARSIISFGIPYERRALERFLKKTDWRSFNINKKEITQRLYRIGDHLVDFLQSEGFEALGVDVNNNYRPEPGARDVSEIVAMVPDFSHRYGAVAAGLGRLGWSGNLMTPQYGSALLLGTVLTAAELCSDPICEGNPCDGCKMCVASCPVEMMHKEESVAVTLAGITEKIARKRTNNCCWIGCDGYHGLSPNRKWSNWSPYRVAYPLPARDEMIDQLCTRIRKSDPDARPDELNLYTNYRQAYFDPDYLFFSVCTHCATVCWPAREDRIKNRKQLTDSGIIVLRINGERSAAKATDDLVEIDTHFHARVVLLRREYESALRGKVEIENQNAVTLKDKAVLTKLKQMAQAKRQQ